MGVEVIIDTNDRATAPDLSCWGGTERANPRLELAVTVALLLFYLVVLAPTFRSGGSADFLALWNAGIALTNGALSEVYPAVNRPFTMLIPPSWQHAPYLAGAKGEVYPFLYPPLWAWAMGQLSRITNFGTAVSVASTINAILVPGMILLAHRIAAPQMKQWLFLVLGLAFVLLPPAGIVALLQNQPQILVSFLTVLAIERAISGRQATAGAVLALAAALKVYPVLLVALWLAAGRYRAVGSFVLVGGALGGLSVVVAGWPLHTTFLALLSSISHSVLLTALSFSVDASIAQVLMPERLALVIAPDDPGLPGEVSGWFVMAEPALMSLAGQVAQIGALVVFAWMLRRRPGPAAEVAIWPLAMVVLALLGPVAWGYHYMAPLAFAPMAFERLGRRTDTVLMLSGAAVISGLRPVSENWTWLVNGPQLVGTLGIVLIAAGFATNSAIWRRPATSTAS